MSLSHSVAEDQLRLVELATARLERQRKRIVKTDPTIPVSKLSNSKPTRSKVTKQWLPADYPESSDGELVSVTSASGKASPFDVHAKVFQPGSRDGSLSRQSEPLRKDSAYLSMDDGDFQLVTNKKTKPSSKPALGLNAHEVKVEDKPSAIAAPFNKREINEVFGNDLPPLDYFQATVGEADGEVHFAMHPNGDISAQQWSNEKYQWVNMGQFSNIRKRTEGSLASHQLRGETEQHSLQKHTLSYFRAVAKQQEATAMGRPFGIKELQNFMPNVHIEHPTRVLTSTPATVETTPRSDPRHQIPEKKQHLRGSALGTDNRPWGQAYQRPNNLGQQKLFAALTAPTFNSTSFQPHYLSTAMDSDKTSASTYENSPKGLTALNNLSFGTYSTRKDRTLVENNLFLPGVEEHEFLLSNTTVPDQYFNPSQPKHTSQATNAQVYSPIPCLEYSTFLKKAQPQTTSAAQATALAQRNFTKACLDKIFDVATSRASNAAPATRTVLHDPFQDQPSKVVSTPPKMPSSGFTPHASDSETKQYDTIWSDSPITQTRSSFSVQAPTSLTTEETSCDLRISEPDFASKPRPVEVVDINLPRMTTEGLAIYSRPSPQNFNGPFFMGSPDVPGEAHRKNQDEELHDWFYGGLKVIERQDEHFQYIKAAHRQSLNTTLPKVHPGPIGPPSAFSTPNKKRESESFNEVTTRLLLSVHESLSQYIQGPLDQRRGFLAPFCDPPEWCIDKGVNGNNSFFGEDWGQPPERISRDSRYRPLPFESKFGAFDNHRGSNVGGLHSSSGRLRFGSGLKY